MFFELLIGVMLVQLVFAAVAVGISKAIRSAYAKSLEKNKQPSE